MNKYCGIYKYILILFSFVFYLLCVYIYSSTTLAFRRNEAIAQIDDRLKTGAYAVYYILSEHFFRRAIHSDSIDPDEDWKNIINLTSYIEHTRLAFIYSVIEKNGNIYVLSSSATQDELNNNSELHYFHHYDTASDELKSTFKDHTIRAVEYRDQWGEFRDVFIPIRINQNK